MAQRESLEFSFSGLKSALARYVSTHEAAWSEQEVADLCAAFQAAVVRTLVSKTIRAALGLQIPRIVVAGGVAANRGLRKAMAEACQARELDLYVPPVSLCTDNAAMVAYAGAVRLALGERDSLDMGPSTMTELPGRTRKGRGRR
jgi:N6-L-threonylcarbamoyladenine synthase